MCDVQGTGANFLLAGIYFTFLFSLVIMVLTTAHFLAGAALEKVTANIKEKMCKKNSRHSGGVSDSHWFTSMRTRIRIQGAKLMRIRADTDPGPGQALPSQKIGF
jgi:hypothetical protein